MKAIGWLIGATLLIIIGLGLYVVMYSGDLVKKAVETLGPEYLGVPVTLESADISLTDGTGELRGLVIGNPQGFEGPHALRMGLIRVALDPMAQSDALIVLNEVVVDEADLALVAHGRQTNLQALLANLEATDEASAEGEQAGPEMKMIIDRFAFTNARVSLDSDVLGSTEISLPDLVLTEIGRREDGILVREAVGQVLRPIVRAATEAVARSQIDVDALKNKAGEQLDKALQDRLGTGLKGLKDRFKR